MSAPAKTRAASATPELPLLDRPLAKSGLAAPAMARNLQRLGIATVRDLVFHFPRRHHDFSQDDDAARAP